MDQTYGQMGEQSSKFNSIYCSEAVIYVCVCVCVYLYVCVYIYTYICILSLKEFRLELKKDLKLYMPFKLSVVVNNC